MPRDGVHYWALNDAGISSIGRSPRAQPSDTLGELGLGRWERVASILGFNLGIEAMQLIVVVAIMPSLVLLSRTRAYSVLRMGGALFAGFASLGWIAERLLNVHNAVDLVVDSAAHHAVWIAGVLFLISLVCWWLTSDTPRKTYPSPKPSHTPISPAQFRVAFRQK